MSEPDCFLRYRTSCNAEFYYVRKIPRTCIGRPSLQRRVVLKLFYSPRAGGTPLSEVMRSTECLSRFLNQNVMVKIRRVHFCGSVNTGWVLKNVWLYLENFTRRAHCYYATLIASRTSIRGAFCDDALYKLTFTFTYHLSKRVFSNDLE